MLYTVKPVLNSHSKGRPKIGFQDRLSLNAGLFEHSAILSTFIKLPFVFRTFVLSIFEWPLMAGFTVVVIYAANFAFEIRFNAFKIPKLVCIIQT